jgi:hypothetical protein
VIAHHAVNVSAPNVMKATARAMLCGMDQCVVKPLTQTKTKTNHKNPNKKTKKTKRENKDKPKQKNIF